MESVYFWLKALHIIAVIAFMAGMLYLPRLFVYHASVAKGSAESEIFKIMERRLEKAIMRPALVVVLLSGVALAWEGHWFGAGWLWAKLVLVAALVAAYGYLIRSNSAFAVDANQHSTLFYRIVNESVTVALIGIVILVVVKPF